MSLLCNVWFGFLALQDKQELIIWVVPVSDLSLDTTLRMLLTLSKRENMLRGDRSGGKLMCSLLIQSNVPEAKAKSFITLNSA